MACAEKRIVVELGRIGVEVNQAFGVGETISLGLRILTNGAPRDLTGYTAKGQLSVGGRVILELDEADGIVLGGVDGTLSMIISAARSAELPPRKIDRKIAITSSGGVVTQVVFGLLKLE